MENKGRKNILLLIPTFADEGGTQKMVYELSKVLAEQHQVYECSFDAFNEKHIFRTNNTVLSLESPPVAGLRKIFDYNTKASKLAKLKKKYSIDVTISNLWAADLVNALSGGTDKKISIGHVNIRGNFQNRLLLRARHLAHYLYSRFDKVVAVNQYLKEELQEVFNLKQEKVIYINNFVVLAQHEPTPIAKTRKRLVSFGRLNAIKNHKPLLWLASRLKENGIITQLVLMGAGPLYEVLLQYAHELKLSTSSDLTDDVDVVFTGFHPDPHSVLTASDLFVFSSQSEGFGLVIVEAMHAGLPVITSDCATGGPFVILAGKGTYKPNRQLPEETSYGFLMPVPIDGDEEIIQHWEKTIKELLYDREKQASMEVKVRERALEFSHTSIKQDWFKLLGEISKD